MQTQTPRYLSRGDDPDCFYHMPTEFDRTTKGVSLAGQGLWMELLCIMHASPERGYLLRSDGSPMTPEQIWSQTKGSGGDTLDNVLAILDELRQADVYAVDHRGAIYSREMVDSEK